MERGGETCRFAKLSYERRNRNKEGMRQGVSASDWTKCNRSCFLQVSFGLCVKECDGYRGRKERQIQELSGALFNDKTSFCWNIH